MYRYYYHFESVVNCVSINVCKKNNFKIAFPIETENVQQIVLFKVYVLYSKMAATAKTKDPKVLTRGSQEPVIAHLVFNFTSKVNRKWGAGLSDTFLKGTHSGTIPARFGLIWFSSFRGEDLNVIFYQNMPNLHNRYKSAERKISQKNPEYMLNNSLPCSCS